MTDAPTTPEEVDAETDEPLFEFETGKETPLEYGMPAAVDSNIEVDDALSFSTDSGTERPVERMAIKLDDNVFYLYRPSDALLYLMGGTLAEGSDDIERINAMMQLIQVSLDNAGSVYLRRRMMDRRNDFDDALLGKIVGAIMSKWGGSLGAKYANTAKKTTTLQPGATKLVDDETQAAENRAARRRAEREAAEAAPKQSAEDIAAEYVERAKKTPAKKAAKK